jgi:hypothetical protein
MGFSLPANAAPAGFGTANFETARTATLVHSRYRRGYGGRRVFIGPTHAWGLGYPHRHRGYPYFGYYGGYYPPGYVDYDYNYDERCYYSRRYRSKVCPDW